VLQLQAVAVLLVLASVPPAEESNQALLSAAEAGDIEGIRSQLKSDANVNTVNPLGDTALTIAARKGDAEIVRLLLDHGAGVDHQNWNGDTALVEAVRYGAPGVVHLLVLANAEVDRASGDGESALTLAKRFEDDRILALLTKREAVPSSGGGAARRPVAVGGAVQPPKKIRSVPPQYPERAQREGVRGTVVLRLGIDEQGRVEDVQLIRSIPLLDAAAVDAVRQWRYAPTLLDGVRTAVKHTASLSFRLAAGVPRDIARGAGDAPEPMKEARAYLNAGRFEEAKEAFEDANREAGGKCPPCLVGEAAAKLGLDDLKGARKAAERALKLSGADPVVRMDAHLTIGFSRLRQARGREKELQKAEAAFRAALEVSPGNPTATYNLGVVLLYLSRDKEGVAELAKFVERAPNAPTADRARTYIANPRRARERFAPDFSARTLEGEKISLGSFVGRILLLDFWGTWCPPCVAAVPELRDLRRRYPEERLAVLGVNVGDADEAWRSFVSSHEMTWLHCRDEDRRIARVFDVRAFPTYILVDEEGAIVAEISGHDDRQSLGYRLRSRIDDLMAAER
jgi:TonB family protein